MIEAVVTFVKSGISAMGYWGVVWMMAVESACIPLPSEIIMPFSGFLVFEGRFNLHLAAFAGAFGNLLGSIAAYALGYYGGRPFLSRYGRFIFIKEHELAVADRFFERYGQATVFFTRMMPLVRTYISLPAGIARMRFVPFCILTFVGSLPWCYLLTFAGVKLGENWKSIGRYTHLLDWLVGGALLVLIVIWLARRFGKRQLVS
ncbi:MAG: hypothetical protein A2Y63_00570 [Candidatus Riflebacteria bacterium RBG_13_59_9]|nr:MAG: hypothetical protein A2Y63_00570 [Candidatus Riflebacteria bacterium RBG_13_59_9]